MTFSMGDGNKLKIRASQARDAILSHADFLLALAAEALKENDVETSTAILVCAREIREAVKKLREKMP